MVAVNQQLAGPVERQTHQEQPAGNWLVARVNDPDAYDESILGGYACGCSGRTLIQINRTMDVDARIQIGLACRADGNRTYLPYRRMPWVVEEYMIHSEPWRCGSCSQPIGTVHMLDGAIVGVDVVCPSCGVNHQIDLTMGALPAKLRQAAFGIEPPAPLLPPPAYDVLRQMWQCMLQQPDNNFVFQPDPLRRNHGRIQHQPSGGEFEVRIDLFKQLQLANLVEGQDNITISRSGMIVCLREFGEVSL